MAQVAESNPALPDINGLNEAEKRHLLHVMKRAKDFEVIEENKLRQPLEGVLSKFTNVVKGWQPRWFTLDPGSGLFNYYYLPSDYDGQTVVRPRSDQRPRGTMHLMGAVVSPSDEDSQTFAINAANGELYKLRAHDAKERQYWVNRLRAAAEFHNQNHRGAAPLCRAKADMTDGAAASLAAAGAADSPVGDTASSGSSFSLPMSPSASSIASLKSNASASNAPSSRKPHSARRVPPEPPRRTLPSLPQSSSSHALPTVGGGVHVPTKSGRPVMATPGVPAPFRNVREVLFLAQDRQEALAAMIEELPQGRSGATNGSGINGAASPEDGQHPLTCLNRDLLQIKATSAATMSALDACLGILLVQQQRGIPSGADAAPPPPSRQVPGPPSLEKRPSKSRILPSPPVADSPPPPPLPPRAQNQTSAATTPTSGASAPAPPSATSASSVAPTTLLAVQQASVQKASPTDSFSSACEEAFLQGTPSLHLETSSQLPVQLGTESSVVAIENREPPHSQPSPPPAIVPVEVEEAKAGVSVDIYRPEDEVPDGAYEETDLGTVDEQHKSVILHLLSQLKLGMDLTKVVLPTFILERRSLLEMYADCMAHPNLFLGITRGVTSEDRMCAFFLWYLTSFHEGRKGAIAKKPYNPIIGEIFRCSWSADNNSTSSAHRMNGTEDRWRLSYHSEQVSHHPPISAFYAECPERGVFLNASIWTRSKFMGMSVGVTMVGKATVYLPTFGEEYVFTLPSAYARSILTTPWVELGDRVTFSCPQSGLTASVTFHTKPFYGGSLHKISGEIKNHEGLILYRAAGEWNGSIEITREATGQSQTYDTKKLPVIRKAVRPVEIQEDNESRRLWRDVTTSLAAGDVEAATDAKFRLEEAQRAGERARAASGTHYPWRFFQKEGDAWVFKDLDENLARANPGFRRSVASTPTSDPGV